MTATPARARPAPDVKRDALIVSLLVLATLAVYGQTIGFGFVDYDDSIYVTENAHVRRGLSLEGLVWSLTATDGGSWHPLTWLSLMLDAEVHGTEAGGFHATAAVLHTINALLLFGALRFMTGALWRSAFVAALFALHPLHVESVAWVSERKDVLTTLFGFGSVWAYAAYARRGGWGRYLLALALAAMALAAKPMLVTLPFVYLLLDYWPLGRLRLGASSGRERPARDSVRALVVEKLPFLALSAASSAMTLVTQRIEGAIAAPDAIPFADRVANALVSCVRYVLAMLWPANLSVLYPHPSTPGGTPLEAWQVGGGLLFLVLVTAAVLRARRRPYLPVGWLWYLGTLVPVIGFVQVGQQSMADRYTYVPLVGLFIVVAWGGADLLARRAGPRAAWVIAVVLLSACATSAWRQAGYWRDSETLFRRALAAAPEPPTIHNNLAFALQRQGRHDEAMRHYRRALEIRPRYANAHYNLGTLFALLGQAEREMEHYRKALEIDPDHANAHYNLGAALQAAGKLDEAIAHYRRALEAKPGEPDVFYNLGSALAAKDRFEEAIPYYTEALRIAPDHVKARNNLAAALAAGGRHEEAVRHYRLALRAEPGHPDILFNLGNALWKLGRAREAADRWREALEGNPEHVGAHYRLGAAMRAEGRTAEAVRRFEEAARLAPEWPRPLIDLAWILATHPSDDVRDPDEAVRLARRAGRLSRLPDAEVLDCLAAAHASAGRFERARSLAEAALERASATDSEDLARRIRARLELYRRGRPYRDAGPSAPAP